MVSGRVNCIVGKLLTLGYTAVMENVAKRQKNPCFVRKKVA